MRTKIPIVVSPHAQMQAKRRGMTQAILVEVAKAPGQVIRVRPGREVRQSEVEDQATGKAYLVRVVVDRTDREDRIVTAYRTSRIDKYWRRA